VNTTRKNKFQAVLAASLLATGLCLAATTASATPITASVGGVPGGTNYENFDTLTLGSGGGTTTSGIIVSFTPDGAAVSGSASGVYAAPVLSGNNGALFGDPSNGPDGTVYLASGAGNGAKVTLEFPDPELYMGLLWGSVDNNENSNLNTLTFYMGVTQVAVFTGADVAAAAGSGHCADGNQTSIGTCYVNINLSTPFDKVVATSSEHAFEFDNVAFDSRQVGVPEPGTVGMFLLGLALLGSGYWFRKRKTA
jgi:hypothetical protein